MNHTGTQQNRRDIVELGEYTLSRIIIVTPSLTCINAWELTPQPWLAIPNTTVHASTVHIHVNICDYIYSTCKYMYSTCIYNMIISIVHVNIHVYVQYMYLQHDYIYSTCKYMYSTCIYTVQSYFHSYYHIHNYSVGSIAKLNH